MNYKNEALAISDGVPLSPDFVSPYAIICHVISLFNWTNLSSDHKRFVLRDVIQILKVPTCSFCLKCIAYKTVNIYIIECPTATKLSGK